MNNEKVTEIIYKNSHDCSEGLIINFENIQKVIGLLSEKENELTLKVEFLFEFKSFEQWVNKSSSWFAPYTRYDKTVCVDTNGRICHIVEDFMKARDENIFPVKAYRLSRSVEADYNKAVV